MEYIGNNMFFFFLGGVYVGNVVGKGFTKQGVCHTVALPFYIKNYLNAKEELWKLMYFTMKNI
jgi:hypothetical protein